MTGRSVPTWKGKTHDSKVPRAVRARVFERAGGRCHITGQVIRAGDAWELEHIKPLSMGGSNSEDNMAPALVAAHREKTAAEAGPRSKADRIHAKFYGYWPKSKTPLRSRGFAPSRSTPSTRSEP